MPNELLPEEERQPSMERRLATIMMADVAGYSRMMGENEERTVQTLRGHREIFDALLGLHRGRIFNTAGDAILAEFPSAVEAVRCATEIQAALRTRNEHLPEEQRMWFRVGINLGDVIVQGGDLLGDGVNVAARIQTIAEPGGVCISGSVYDQIQNKLSLQFKMMGERSFKNIAQPIRTFSISEADGTAMPVASGRERPKRTKLAGIILALVVLIAATGSGFWVYHNYEARRAEELRRAIEVERQAAETKRQADDAQRQLRRPSARPMKLSGRRQRRSTRLRKTNWRLRPCSARLNWKPRRKQPKRRWNGLRRIRSVSIRSSSAQPWKNERQSPQRHPKRLSRSAPPVCRLLCRPRKSSRELSASMASTMVGCATSVRVLLPGKGVGL